MQRLTTYGRHPVGGRLRSATSRGMHTRVSLTQRTHARTHAHDVADDCEKVQQEHAASETQPARQADGDQAAGHLAERPRGLCGAKESGPVRPTAYRPFPVVVVVVVVVVNQYSQSVSQIAHGIAAHNSVQPSAITDYGAVVGVVRINPQGRRATSQSHAAEILQLTHRRFGRAASRY